MTSRPNRQHCRTAIFFNVFSQEMSTEEREAMTFLYAYMTPGDITDYPGEFYLKNVRLAFGTRESMPWGQHSRHRFPAFCTSGAYKQ